MDNGFHDFEQLESLLRKKGFAELTGDEKTRVLQHLGSEEAYAALRLTETQLTHAFQSQPELIPRSGSKKLLLERVRDARPQPSAKAVNMLARIVSYRIPAYQAVAGLLFLAGAFLGNANRQSREKRTGGFAAQKDTVFIAHHDTVFKEEKVFVVRNKFVYKSPAATKPTLNHDTTGMAVPEQVKNPTAQGVSMKEDTLLWSLIVKKPSR